MKQTLFLFILFLGLNSTWAATTIEGRLEFLMGASGKEALKTEIFLYALEADYNLPDNHQHKLIGQGKVFLSDNGQFYMYKVQVSYPVTKGEDYYYNLYIEAFGSRNETVKIQVDPVKKDGTTRFDLYLIGE